MDQVREGRKPGWFWADNKVLDVYAKEIGPHATLVYMVLVRHLNAEGQCWPSFQYIADMVGLSRRAVMRAIDVLDTAKLIVVEKRFTEKKGQTTNCYTIVDMQDIAAHEPRRASPVPPVTDSHSPSDTDALPPVTDSHSNKTYRNKTQGTSGGDTRENAAAAISQTEKDLMAAGGLNLKQARTAVKLQQFTPEIIGRIKEWADKLRAAGKNPGAILCGYTDAGLLPDDLPQPARKRMSTAEANEMLRTNPGRYDQIMRGY